MKKLTIRVTDEQYQIIVDGTLRTGLSIQGFVEKLIESSGPLMKIHFGVPSVEQRPFQGSRGRDRQT